MNEKMATPFVPISWGELIDKITILEIKKMEVAGKIVANIHELVKKIAKPGVKLSDIEKKVHNFILEILGCFYLDR